jgi:hypothetical protein
LSYFALFLAPLERAIDEGFGRDPGEEVEDFEEQANQGKLPFDHDVHPSLFVHEIIFVSMM